MTSKKMIIDGCENWVKNHYGEDLILEFSAVIELLELLKEQEDKIRQLRLALQILNGNGIKVDTEGR